MLPPEQRPPYLRGCRCGWCNAQRTEYEGSDGAAAVEGMTGLGTEATAGLPRSETREITRLLSKKSVELGSSSTSLLEASRWMQRRML